MKTEIKINYVNEKLTVGSNIEFKGLQEFNDDNAVIYYEDKGLLFDFDKTEINMIKRFLEMCKGEHIIINVNYNENDGDYFVIFKCEDKIKHTRATLEFRKYDFYHQHESKAVVEIMANVLLDGLKTMLTKQKQFSMYFEDDKPILLLDNEGNYIAIAVML